MTLDLALTTLIGSGAGVAVAWLALKTVRHLKIRRLLRTWLLPYFALRWVRVLRKHGVPEKEIRKFLVEYALKTEDW